MGVCHPLLGAFGTRGEKSVTILLRSRCLGVGSEGKLQKLDRKNMFGGAKEAHRFVSAVTQENLYRKALGGDVMDS